jgi:energy-coupling factor transport system substrate-specific component
MLGLHALSIPPEAVLITEMILVCVAIFAIISEGIEARTPRSLLWITGIVMTLSAGRVLFEPLPNIQPVTIGLLLIGATYGIRRGIGIAILVTIITNIYLGTGIWTLFQAGAWSIIAIGGAVAANQLIIDEKVNLGRLMISGIIAAFVFDFTVSLSVLISDPTPSIFIAYLITGLPFDLLHAAGNVVIAITLGSSMHRLLAHSLSPTKLNIRGNINESRVE